MTDTLFNLLVTRRKCLAFLQDISQVTCFNLLGAQQVLAIPKEIEIAKAFTDEMNSIRHEMLPG